MSDTIINIIFGMCIAFLIMAKSPVDFLRELDEKHPSSFGYILLATVWFVASALLGWAGFCVVLATFVFYHLLGTGAWSPTISKFFKNLSRFPKYGSDDDTQATSEVSDDDTQATSEVSGNDTQATVDVIVLTPVEDTDDESYRLEK